MSDIRALSGAKRRYKRLQRAALAGTLPSSDQPEMYCDRCFHFMDEVEFDDHLYNCADNEDIASLFNWDHPLAFFAPQHVMDTHGLEPGTAKKILDFDSPSSPVFHEIPHHHLADVYDGWLYDCIVTSTVKESNDTHLRLVKYFIDLTRAPIEVLGSESEVLQNRSNPHEILSSSVIVIVSSPPAPMPLGSDLASSSLKLGRDGFPLNSVLSGEPPLVYTEPEFVQLHEILPPGRNYLLYAFCAVPAEDFLGAPEGFHACFRVDIRTLEEAEAFINEINTTSMTTFRMTSKKSEAKLKGIQSVYHGDFHCIHSLAVKMKQGKVAVAKELERDPADGNTRRRCTQCPTMLRLYVQGTANTKKAHKASHPCVVKIKFIHNHPLESAHALSFRDVSVEAKAQYFALFNQKHYPATARREYQKALQQQPGYRVTFMANRALNPTVQDLHRMHADWVMERFGARNGAEAFSALDESVAAYNASGKGRAVYQPFKEWTEDGIVKKQPFILAFVSAMMVRVHAIPQAGEVVGMDASAGLDELNIAAYVFNTPTTAGGLNLGVIFASDEEESTFASGLTMLCGILPLNAFGGRGITQGPAVFMTDDCAGPRNALRHQYPSATFCFVSSTYYRHFGDGYGMGSTGFL